MDASIFSLNKKRLLKRKTCQVIKKNWQISESKENDKSQYFKLIHSEDKFIETFRAMRVLINLGRKLMSKENNINDWNYGIKWSFKKYLLIIFQDRR